jgi:hypothetical protein
LRRRFHKADLSHETKPDSDGLTTVDSIEQIRMSKGFRSVARVLGVIAIVLVATTLILDKSLPYRIGPGNYVLFLSVERLAFASIAVVILALFLGVAARQWVCVILTVVGMFFLLSIGGPHSGPNPEAWCYINLRKIDAAKNQLAEKSNLTNGTVVTSEHISAYIEGGFASLECAKHGNYIINPIGTEPRCTFHGSMSEMETNWNKASH